MFSIKNIINFLLAVVLLTACSQPPQPLYESEAYTIYPDRVEQGEYTAVAKSETHLVSDYQSEESQFFDPRIQFKFSINGRDNELPYNTDHRANIYPSGTDSVVLSITFGEQTNLRGDMPVDESLPPNTKVTFKLDFTPVLEAFDEKGYFEGPRGERVYKDDFKGVYIAGSAYPLSWDFENLANNPGARLTDEDGDGIYEITLKFNDYDPSAHVSSEWKLQNDIEKYPRFVSDKPLLNAIYNMSLDEMVMLQEEDGTFRTGKEWSGVWTRDISYSVYLSLAMLEPEICKTSLMRKVKNNRIIQDTGTGGAWPVSSDREVWSLAAWEIYKYTGDRDWLKQAYEIISNSIRDDEKTVYNAEYGLFSGESSFLDWRKQTYPLWMQPTDIYASLNLGTNMVFFQTLNILDQMAGELNMEGTSWEQKAQDLKKSINKYFWTQDGYYGQYLYGDRYFSLSPKAETLGEALSIIFDVADDARKSQILASVPNLDYGTPCIYPQIPNIPPYHNNGIWPFVQAYWTLAAAKDQHTELVEYGYGSILRQAALFLTNKENFVAETGDFAGTEINSDRQQWSVAGQLAMNYRVLFGMQLGVNHLSFQPVIPETFKGIYHLNGFQYRDAVLNITVEGFGDGAESFYVDGELQDKHQISAGLTGHHDVRIVMNEVVKDKPFNLADFRVSPETPDVRVDGDSLKWTPVNNAVKYQIIRNGEWIAESENPGYAFHQDSLEGEYQVMAIDEKGSQSFLSEPVVVEAKDKLVLEAEDFNLASKRENPGFIGSGYVQFSKANNSTLTFRAGIPEEGEWFISFRYANGSGPVNTDNKCAIRSLFVNGQFASSLVFPQRGTNEWANWGVTNTIPLKLNQGTNEFEINFEPFNENMNGDVNRFLLDQIVLERL